MSQWRINFFIHAFSQVFAIFLEILHCECNAKCVLIKKSNFSCMSSRCHCALMKINHPDFSSEMSDVARQPSALICASADICFVTGISGKSQILFALVFTTRYLDLLTSFISLYNTSMKVKYLSSYHSNGYFLVFLYKKCLFLFCLTRWSTSAVCTPQSTWSTWNSGPPTMETMTVSGWSSWLFLSGVYQFSSTMTSHPWR